jgi:hypothetical protein
MGTTLKPFLDSLKPVQVGRCMFRVINGWGLLLFYDIDETI